MLSPQASSKAIWNIWVPEMGRPQQDCPKPSWSRRSYLLSSPLKKQEAKKLQRNTPPKKKKNTPHSHPHQPRLNSNEDLHLTDPCDALLASARQHNHVLVLGGPGEAFWLAFQPRKSEKNRTIPFKGFYSKAQDFQKSPEFRKSKVGASRVVEVVVVLVGWWICWWHCCVITIKHLKCIFQDKSSFVSSFLLPNFKDHSMWTQRYLTHDHLEKQLWWLKNTYRMHYEKNKDEQKPSVNPLRFWFCQSAANPPVKQNMLKRTKNS